MDPIRATHTVHPEKITVIRLGTGSRIVEEESESTLEPPAHRSATTYELVHGTFQGPVGERNKCARIWNPPPPRPGTESRFWDARGPGRLSGELGPRASPNRATVPEPGSVLGRGWYWNAPGAGTRERYWNAKLVLERGGGTGTPSVLERGNGTGTRNWSWNHAGRFWNANGAGTRPTQPSTAAPACVTRHPRC